MKTYLVSYRKPNGESAEMEVRAEDSDGMWEEFRRLTEPGSYLEGARVVSG